MVAAVLESVDNCSIYKHRYAMWTLCGSRNVQKTFEHKNIYIDEFGKFLFLSRRCKKKSRNHVRHRISTDRKRFISIEKKSKKKKITHNCGLSIELKRPRGFCSETFCTIIILDKILLSM